MNRLASTFSVASVSEDRHPGLTTVALGALLLSLAVADLLIDDDGAIDTLERAFPLAVAVAFLAVGLWYWRRGDDMASRLAVGLGGFAGGISFATFTASMLLLVSLEQRLLLEPSYVVLNGAALGTLVGSLLGYQYDQIQRRTRRLRQYETIVQAVGDPVYALDERGRYTFLNESFIEQTGYDREELLGAHVSEIVPEEYVEEGRARIEDLLEHGGHTATFEMERRIRNGDTVVVENNLTLLTDADGAFRGTAGVLRDISDRKEWERRLEALAAALESFMRAGSLAELFDEATTTVTEVLGFGTCSVRTFESNTGTLVRTASSTESVAWTSDMQRYDAETTPPGRAYRTGDIVVDEVQEDDPYGRDPLTAALYVPLGDYGVICVGTVGETFDRDDRRLVEILASGVEASRARLERERELREQVERLDRFASIVSHDLRNPLNVLSGRLDLARETGDDEHFEHCQRAVDRMETLIEDVLTLARTNERAMERERVELASTVAACWETVTTAEATLVAETTRTVSADPGQLRQLFENLFRNAVEHGGEEVTVTVGDLPSGFYVEDDGPGIPESEREDVFDSGYTTHAAGTGFGLSIVQRIVDAHGWTIEVTDGDDGGARFEILFSPENDRIDD